MLGTNRLTPATPEQDSVLRRLRLRPKRYRRGLIRVLVPVLALLILAGPTAQLTSQRAAAHAATISMQINTCGGEGNPNYLIQKCDLRTSSLLTWETDVINRYMQSFGLPASDRDQVLDWERDALRALMFTDVYQAISKDQSDQTNDEKAVLARMSEIIREKRTLAAQVSIDEYNEWNFYKCGYIAPAGFHYQIDLGACLNPIGGMLATPRPPSLEDFLLYGAASAYGEYQLDPAFVASLAELPRTVGLISAIALVTAAGTPFLLAGIAGLITAIHAYLAFAVAVTGSSAISAGVAGAASVLASVGLIFGVVATIVLGIVIAVIQAVAVVTDAAIPGQLADNLAAAQAPPDLQAMKNSDQGRRELLMAFVELTLPVPASSPAVPATQPTDPQFQITDANGVRTSSPTINYQCWNPVKCGENINHSARMTDRWFVDMGVQTSPRMTLGIDYLDWNGQAWTAWRFGNQFLHVRTGDTSAPFLSRVINFKGTDGTNKIATILTPLFVQITSGAPSAGSDVTFEIGGSNAVDSGVTYSWDFGDGSATVSSTEPKQTHAYAAGGTYTLTVTATGENANEIPPLTFLVSTTPPILAVDDTPFASPEGTEINLTATAEAVGDGGDVTITWTVYRYDFTQNPWFQPWVSGTGGAISFTPDNGGFAPSVALPPVIDSNGNSKIEYVLANFQVVIVATDSHGQMTSKTVNIHVTNVAPTINSLTTSADLVEGNSIYLQVDASDPGWNEQRTSTWSVTKNGQPYPVIQEPWSIGFVPDDEGTYVVTFTLDDGDGGSDTHSEAFEVLNVAPQIEGRAVTIDENEEVLLRGIFRDPGVLDPLTLTVDWQDGSAAEVITFPAGTTDFEVPHTYLDDAPSGTALDDYVVSLQVADNGGGAGSSTSTITVTNVAPTVDLTIQRASGEALNPGDSIHLGDEITVIASYDDAGTLDTRTALIDWGDGSTSNLGAVADETTSKHVYTRSGSFTMSVRVTDDDTGVGEASQVVAAQSAGAILTETLDDLQQIQDDNPRAGATIRPIRLILEGVGGGQNSVANQLDSSRPEIGLLRIRLALILIAFAEAFNPSLDLTSVKIGLTEAARTATIATLIKAQAKAEADGTIGTSERTMLNRANALINSGDLQLTKGNYANAVNNYLIATGTLGQRTR